MTPAAYQVDSGRSVQGSATDAIDRFQWDRIHAELDASGCAVVKNVLSPDACRSLVALYPDDTRFRTRIVMARHGFGRGEYKYFAHPLPALIAELRRGLYGPLSHIANQWNEAMGFAERFPSDHPSFLELCHQAGQTKPTPLLLRYAEGDYNCLHQDIYGEHLFPLQVAFLLSVTGRDFMGGEFVLTEQRPRMQSRVEVVPLEQGDGVIFPVRQRPARGAHGSYRVTLRHGVSRVCALVSVTRWASSSTMPSNEPQRRNCTDQLRAIK